MTILLPPEAAMSGQKTRWASVHTQSRICLVAVQQAETLIKTVAGLSLNEEQKTQLVSISRDAADVCRAHSALNLKGKPDVDVVVTADLYMDYYNTYGELTKLIGKTQSIVMRLEKLL